MAEESRFLLALAAMSLTQELFMKKAEYGVFEALNPFFEVVLRGLSGLVDGNTISIRLPIA